MSPIDDAKTTERDPVDADKLELDSQEDIAVNKEVTVSTKLDSLEKDLKSSKTENKDLEKDKIIGDIDSNHVLKSTLSEDFKTDKTFKDSNETDTETDEKSITETGRFDVIKVEESEVGVAQQTTSETPELSLDENDGDLQKETSDEAVNNTSSDEKEEIQKDPGTKTIEEKHLTPLIQVDPIHEVSRGQKYLQFSLILQTHILVLSPLKGESLLQQTTNFGLNIFYLYTLYIEQHIKTHNNIQYTNGIQKKVF